MRKDKKRETKKQMQSDVKYLEQYLKEIRDSIFVDEELQEHAIKILNLPTDERRLFLIFILKNQSIKKTAEYFKIPKNIVSVKIIQIINKLNLNLNNVVF